MAKPKVGQIPSHKPRFEYINDPNTRFDGVRLYDTISEEPAATAPESNGILRDVGDLGLSVAKGVIGVPEALVGLANIPTMGRAGKFVEDMGFRFKDAKDVLSGFQSDELKQKQQDFQQADGILAKTGIALTNPSLIGNAVAESLPLMGAGGVAARGITAVAPKVPGMYAAAMGEGLAGAGSAAEQIRQQTDDGYLSPTQSGLAGLVGAATGIFGAVGNRASKALGIGDIDNMIAQGSTQVAARVGADGLELPAKGILRRGAEGAFSEGFLEELPQSLSEQALQNIALGKDWTEGLADAGVMGTLAGNVMGAGAGIFAKPSMPKVDETPEQEAARALGKQAADKAKELVTEVGPLTAGLNAKTKAEIDAIADAAKALADAPSSDPGIDAGGSVGDGMAGTPDIHGMPGAEKGSAESVAKITTWHRESEIPALLKEVIAGLREGKTYQELGIGFGADDHELTLLKDGQAITWLGRGFTEDAIASGRLDPGYLLAQLTGKNRVPVDDPEALDKWMEDNGIVQKRGDKRVESQSMPKIGLAGTPQEIELNQATEAERAAYEASFNEPMPPEVEAMTKAQRNEILASNTAPAGGEQYVDPKEGDILNGQGQPFKTKLAAMRRAQALGDEYAMATVFDGYVVRKKDANVSETPDLQSLPATDLGDTNAVSPANVGTGSAVPAGPEANTGANEADSLGKSGELPGGVDAGAVNSPEAPANIALPATENIADVQNTEAPAAGTKAEATPIEAPEAVASDAAPAAELPGAGSAKVEGDGVKAGDWVKPTVGTDTRPRQVDSVGDDGWVYTKSGDSFKPGQFEATTQPVTKPITGGTGVAQDWEPPANQVSQPAQPDTQPDQQSGARVQFFQPPTEKHKKGILYTGEIVTRGGKQVVTLDKDSPSFAAGVREVAYRENGGWEPAQPGVPGEGAGVSQPTQDANPLRQKALDRIAKGTAYFGSIPKGNEWIVKNGLKDTHTLEKDAAKPRQFNVVPKPTESTNAQTPEAQQAKPQQPAQAVAEPPAQTEWTRTRDVDRYALLLKAGYKERVAQNLKGKNWTNLVPDVQAKLEKLIAPVEAPSQSDVEAAKTVLDKPISSPVAGNSNVFTPIADKGPHFASGVSDFKQGKPRTLPSYFTKPGDKNSKDWYRGWDAANAAAPVAESEPSKGLGEQLAELNNELERQGRVKNANTVAQRDSIRNQIAQEDFPDIFKAVDGDIDVAEELNSAFKYAGDEPKAKTIARILKKRGVTPEYQARWTERLMDGQNDELDAEMQSYEAKKNPTYSGEPKAEPKPAPEVKDEVMAKLQEEMKDALGDLGDILGKPYRASIAPEKTQKLMPVLTRVMDIAFRMGHHKFKEAAKFVLDTIRAKFGNEAADEITLKHLQGAYIGMSGDHDGADDFAAVGEVKDKAELEKPAEIADAATGATPSLANSEGRHAVAQSVADHLIGGGKFDTIIQARKFISELTGEKIEAATDAAKRADEAIELGVVIASRDIVQAARKQGRSDQVIFDRLMGIYEAQPSLNVRDSVSLRNQAYSTPVPLAFLASRLARVTPQKLAGEPTAGNGALMMEADPKTSTVNEIQDDRLEALKSQGFTPTQNDAAAMQFKPKSLDSMVMNPPFGAVNGQKWTFGDFTTGEIDHAIVLNSLEALKDNGDAVLIIGGMLAREDSARKDGYRGKAKREFFFKLYSQYNVVDHFTVSGDLYKKQGAAYPVDVIVIKGRGKSARGLPAAELPKLIDTWEQVKEKLNESESMGTQGAGDTRGDTSDSNANTQPGQLPGDSVGSPAITSAGRPGGRSPGIGNSGGRGTSTGSTGGGKPTKQGRQPDSLGQRGNDLTSSQNGDTGGSSTQGSGQQQGGTGSTGSNNSDAVGNGSGKQSDTQGITDAAESGKLQVKYQNFSGNNSVNTLVATNHLSAIEGAFKSLEKRVGNIDEFVRAELQYEPEAFKKAFSAEQVEALALAIDNINQGKGFIIGDQTGIGKGRVVAAMIRYAKLNGKTPVFVTQMPDLYGDMMRDLNDIGMTNTKPLMTNNGASVPLDSAALDWFSEKQGVETRITELQDAIESVAVADLGANLSQLAPDARAKAIATEMKASTNPEAVSLREEIDDLKESLKELRANRRGKFLDTPDIKTHEAMLEQMVNSGSIGDYDVIFTTYNQMAALDSGKPKKDANGRKTPARPATFGYRNTFLKSFINDKSMLILDESHNAGARGEDIRFPKVGDVVRQFVQASGGVFYSSATFAKNTEVMDVYSKTDLGSAFANPGDLVNAVNSVPMQQITSAMLVEAGQYLRRERSFDGITYETAPVEVDQQAAEDLANAMRLVVAFDAAKIKALNDIQNELDSEGAAISTINGGGSAASVDSTNFTSVMHNVVGTFLLALKADATANLAVNAIRNGEKPIITVANTMEMFITEYAKDAGIGIGDKLDATFSDVMKRYLDKTRKAKIKHANGDTEVVQLTDAQLGPDGVDAYNAAYEFIDEMGMDIPLSPIDHIKQKIEEAGFSIGEITGRQTVVESGSVADQPTVPETNFTFKTVEAGKDLQNWYSRYAKYKPYKMISDWSVGKVISTDEEGGRAVIVGQTKESEIGNIYFVAKDLVTGELFVSGPPTTRLTGETIKLDRDYQKELDSYHKEIPAKKGGFGGVLRSRNKAEMKTAGKKNTIAKYNGGGLDALIINRSGSTGLSMHASATFADQRRRVMIIAQAELDINNHMQMLGRINRTGQVTTGPFDAGMNGTYQGRSAQYGLPRYAQMTANVPIELRPAAVLSNKMAGLNANTTAGRKSAVEDKTALDFMNKYGDRVAAELVGGDFAINEQLGFPIRFDDQGNVFIPGSMGRVTGRIGLLPLKAQTELYSQLATGYADLISQLDALGQNDLEAKTYPVDAETVERKVVQKADKDSSSPFTAAVVAEKVNMKKLGKPYPKSKVQELIAQALNGVDPMEARRRILVDTTNQINEEVKALQDSMAAADPDSRAGIQKRVDALNGASAKLRQSLPAIGLEVMLKTDSGNLYGVVTGIDKTGKAKSAGSLSAWKIRIAVVDGARSMTLPLTQIVTDESAPVPENSIVMKRATEMTLPNAERNGFDTVPILEAFDRGQSDSRETRVIITGNILRGYAGLRGRLLNYTDNKGGIRQGILMPPDFDMESASARFTPALTTPDEVISLLDKGGVVIDKSNAGETLRFKKVNGSYLIEVSKTGTGKRLAKNAGSLNFVSSGNKMRVRVWDSAEVKAFIKDTAFKEGIYLIPDSDSVKLLDGDDTPAVFSHGTGAGASISEVTQVVDDLLAQFAHKPPVRILDTAVGVLPGVKQGDAVSGAVHRGRVHLFLDNIPNRVETVKTLFHELLHYGLRRFLSKDEYKAQMLELYSKDMWVRYQANQWLATPEGQKVLAAGDKDYARARGVDEALAMLAESNQGAATKAGPITNAFRAVVDWIAGIAQKRGFNEAAAFLRGITSTQARAYVQGVFTKLKTDAPATSDDWSFTADPAFRSDADTPADTAKSQDFQQKTRDFMGDLIKSSGKVSFWQRTIGTQYHKAQKHPAFKKVYDLVQNYISGTSTFANNAAELAKGILPQLESLSDLNKAWLSKADQAAISAPIFHGTLLYTRNENGDLMETDDVATAGVVFTDDELKAKFKLNDGQIDLYRQFRAAVDKSLSDAVVTDALRYLGKDIPADLKRMAVDKPEIVRQAITKMVKDKASAAGKALMQLQRERRDTMKAYAKSENERISKIKGPMEKANAQDAHMTEWAEMEAEWDKQEDKAQAARDQAVLDERRVLDKFSHIDGLMARGYAPLTRFGDYFVTVNDPKTGEVTYFDRYDTEREANKAAREMAGDGEVSQGKLPTEAHKLFAGMTPETVEMFGNAIGADQKAAFEGYIKMAKNQRSTMKRLIKRKGTAGYSEDVTRVLASFITSTARASSGNLYLGDANKAALDIKDNDGQIQDEAVKLVKYVQDPTEEMQKLRGFMFIHFMGGSVASALVNMSQPFMMTLPYLSQFSNPVKASALLLKSMKLAAGGVKEDSDLGRALKRAEQDGTVSPQEIHQLQAEVTKSSSNHRLLRKAGFVWGSMFSLAEQFNRRVTFIAAYQQAVESGNKSPFSFAENAVNETQGVYNKGNRPNWGRGAVGATAMTFKQYSVSYMEFLGRLPNREKAFAMGLLMLAAGAGGLPGADDLDDLIDTLGQKLGYNWNSKREKREFLESFLGKAGADFALRGVSSFLPLDIAGRLGTGNLIPGTGLLLEHKRDHTQDATEVLGPIASLMTAAKDAAGAALGGDVKGTLEALAPVAAKNIMKSADMMDTGMYRDMGGRKVIDTTTTDALFKGIGFQPSGVAKEMARTRSTKQDIDLVKAKESAIAEKWANAKFEGDTDGEDAARAALVKWNRANPEAPIRINMADIRKRVMNMRQDRQTRTIKAATPEMRGYAREALQ